MRLVLPGFLIFFCFIFCACVNGEGPTNHADTSRKELYSDTAERAQPSKILSLLADLPEGTISFAAGAPTPKAFPERAIRIAVNDLLTIDADKLLQYGSSQGYLPLREQIAKEFSDTGAPTTADQILITNGAQQALSLLAEMYVNPNDLVFTEDPAYEGAILGFRSLGANVQEVMTDENGINVDALSIRLQEKRPKMIYSIPTFQNPSGYVFPQDRREKLVKAALDNNVVLIEDGAYDKLYYGATPPVRMYVTCQKEKPGNSNCIYVGTFSKVLSPGLRVGYVVSSKENIEKLTVLKGNDDILTSLFNQSIVSRLWENGEMDKNIEKLRVIYREKRDAIEQALQKYMADQASWTTPDGGFYVWLTLKNDVDTEVLFEKAKANKVVYVPGVHFSPSGKQNSSMRLSFSLPEPKDIEEGIKRLAEVID